MDQPYSCIIIDDEPNAVSLLTSLITDLLSFIEIKASCTVWTDALRQLQQERYDIIFLDVSMPGKNGIDLIRLVPGLDSEIIFTTAYQDYAIEAFRLCASGYVLKPIDEAELLHAVHAAAYRIDHKRKARRNQEQEQLAADEIIGVPGTHGIDYLNTGDILFLEALNKCTRVVTAKGELVSSYNIGKFKELLLAPHFFVVHRSFNLFAVRRYLSQGIVVMSDKTEIPIARSLRDEFLHKIRLINRSNVY
jgi:two-component system, LytTR family, response regulator